VGLRGHISNLGARKLNVTNTTKMEKFNRPQINICTIQPATLATSLIAVGQPVRIIYSSVAYLTSTIFDLRRQVYGLSVRQVGLCIGERLACAAYGCSVRLRELCAS
jgi:hypothetical protein